MMQTYFIFAGRTKTSYRVAKNKQGKLITVTASTKLIATILAAGKCPGKWVTVRPLKSLK